MNTSAQETPSGALLAYAQGGHREVAGWLAQVAIDSILTLATTQSRLAVAGSICEIGIHHGRSFILLHLLSNRSEVAVAYDLFELQEENVDGSGSGDKRTFLNNLSRHSCDTSRIVVRTKNSLTLTPAEVLFDAKAPVRIFSVDGGHTADITASDLSVAEASLCDGGLLILDDFFNEEWPGVAEGTSRHLLSGKSKLVPVAIGGNKFIFTNRSEFAAQYQEALLGTMKHHSCKRQIAFGSPVVVVQADVSTLVARLAKTGLWKRVRTTRAGRALKPIALRLLGR